MNQWRSYQMLEREAPFISVKPSAEDFLATVLHAIWGNRLETVSHDSWAPRSWKKSRGFVVNVQTKMEN